MPFLEYPVVYHSIFRQIEECVCFEHYCWLSFFYSTSWLVENQDSLGRLSFASHSLIEVLRLQLWTLVPSYKLDWEKSERPLIYSNAAGLLRNYFLQPACAGQRRLLRTWGPLVEYRNEYGRVSRRLDSTPVGSQNEVPSGARMAQKCGL